MCKSPLAKSKLSKGASRSHRIYRPQPPRSRFKAAVWVLAAGLSSWMSYLLVNAPAPESEVPAADATTPSFEASGYSETEHRIVQKGESISRCEARRVHVRVVVRLRPSAKAEGGPPDSVRCGAP